MRTGSFQFFDPLGNLEPGITVLEASAGTGKTYSITSLFLRLVAEHGLEVDEILVVTFTNAATAELKDRIRVRLRRAARALADVQEGRLAPGDIEDEVVRRLADAPEAERQRRGWNAQRALFRMDDAAISTIHGFCHRVLERHPVETGVDFDATLVEADRDLLDEAVTDAYISTLDPLDPDLARSLRQEDVRDVVRAVLHEIQNHPDATLLATVDPERPAPDPAAWWARFRQFHEEWSRHRDNAVAMLVEARERKQVDGRRIRRDRIEKGTGEVESWFHKTRVPFASPPDELNYFCNDYLREATKAGCSPPSHPLFDLATDFRRDMVRMNEEFAAFRQGLAVRMLHEARGLFAGRKRADRVWSFQDLLVHVREALRNPRTSDALVRALRAQYRAALIDEFQDTDGVQWEIFRRLFDAPGHFLYLIGDPKQAIYAFRGADLHAYLAARDRAGQRFTLGVNWRSDGRWVQALNALYERATRPFHDPAIEYVRVQVPASHQEDRLRFPGQTRAPFVIRVFRRPGDGSGQARSLTKEALWDEVPRVVADDVARLLASGAEVRGEGPHDDWRPLGPRDIAILVRKHDQARAMQRALRRKGIPSVLYSEASVFESEAATDLAVLLTAVAHPEDRRALKSALATRILGHGVPEVLAIEQRDDEWTTWVERFQGFGDAWRQDGFVQMFRKVLHDFGVLPRVLGLEGGERYATDLLHLGEILQQTESELGYGPEALVSWFLRERVQPTGDSDARQLRLESDEDAVEVVTMHRAKGLEYPVVFCPYLWDGSLQEANPNVVRFHDGQRIVLAASKLMSGDDWNQAREQAKREVFAENLRLAYVALTRARHQCHVYWAPATDHETSPLAWLLFPPDEGREEKIEAATLDDAGMMRALQALSETSNGTIEVRPVDPPEEAPRVPARPTRVAAVQGARAARPGFDTTWQWTSFTQIVASRDGEHPGDDDRGRLLTADAGGDALLRDFPRGRVAGRCLHRVFERLDFAADDPEPLVREVLSEYGLDAEALARPVAEAVRVTLETPLSGPDGPVCLRDVGMSDRLNEVSFLLPVAGGLAASGDAASLEALARAFERHGGRLGARYAGALRALRAPSWRGFLSGQMDLVFRAGSRWYLADYKSNDLGPRLADYTQDPIEREMVASYYFLQYHLYAVALYRYGLARGTAFEWDRDVGGVFYLFVRGLDGTGRTGVFCDRPSGALVSALSRILESAG